MPYKDPVKAALQKQRWAELHPEYMKAKHSEVEKRNKRWKTKHRQDYMRRWRESHRERLRWYGERHRLLNTERLKERKHEFYLRHKDEINRACAQRYQKNKVQILERQKAYVKANKHRYNELSRIRYYSNLEENRNKSRLAAIKSYRKHIDLNRAKAVDRGARRKILIAATIDPLERVDLFIWKLKTDPQATCSYCGKDIAGKVAIDHVIPLSRGGRHRIENLCAACETCNISKGNKTIAEWEEVKRLRLSKGSQNAKLP